MNRNKNGFTLVELLSVIVILAIILVIAVPSITSTITESRKGALASSAKLIASSAESTYISNQTLGIEKTIACEDVSNYTKEDYKSCYVEFVDGKANVTIIGKGKFEGMSICGGTKEDATITMENKCYVETTSFADDSWSTIVKAVKSNSTENYNVGDAKEVDLGELGTHTLRISNMSECDGTLESETACGFVLEFADIISTHNMNPSGEYKGTTYEYGWNKDGWPASSMREYVNETIYNSIPTELRSGIIKTKVVSSVGSKDINRTEGNFVSTDKLYLLSLEEVYGTSYSSRYDTSKGTSRQLDYYSTYENVDGTVGVTASNYIGAIKENSNNLADYWWLRTASSHASYDFMRIENGDNGNIYYAYCNYGVSPAFRLA